MPLALTGDPSSGTLRPGDVAALAFLALALHLTFLALLPERWRANQSSDFTRFYAPVAEHVVAGWGPVLSDGSPAVEYPPGYPLILAALFTLARAMGAAPATVLGAFQALGAMVTSIEIGVLAGRVGGRRVGWWAALAWASYPLHLWLTKQPNVEIPFLMLLFGVLPLLPRALSPGAGRAVAGWSFAIGAAVGCASLIRPIALFFAVPLTVWGSRRPAIPHRHRLAFCGFLLLGNLVAIAPWMLWTHARLGEWIPLGTRGRLSVVDGLTFALDQRDQLRPLDVASDVLRLQETVRDSWLKLDDSRDIACFLAATFAEQPAAAIKLLGLKAIRSWYGTYTRHFEGAIAALQAVYLILAGWGLSIAWRRGDVARSWAEWTLLTTAYFWTMSILVLSIVRYMMPAMGLLMIFVALTLDDVWTWLASRRSPAHGAPS